jgi:arsenate reductase
MATALFICLHNAGRSQMSQALFERAADGQGWSVSGRFVRHPSANAAPRLRGPPGFANSQSMR